MSSCLNWMFCNMELHHWQFWLTLILKIQSLIQINVYCNAGVGKYRNVPLVPGLVVWKKLLVRTKYYLSWFFFTFNTCKHICWFMSVSVDFFLSIASWSVTKWKESVLPSDINWNKPNLFHMVLHYCVKLHILF